MIINPPSKEINSSLEGDVVYLHIVGRPLLILNSAKAMRDLLEKRGASFSDRPRIVVLGEMYVMVFGN